VDRFFAQFKQSERPWLVWLSFEIKKKKKKRDLYLKMNKQ